MNIQETLPHVMVLEYQPELTRSVWVDYYSKRRTIKALVAELRREILSGRFVGYRFVTIHSQEVGAIKGVADPVKLENH